MLREAVFLDRDGTVNEEVEYLAEPARLRLIPGAALAIRLLNEAGILAIVITNQAGVGRGYFSGGAVEAVHAELAMQLGTHGARLDAIYHCPHHPDAGCACRKPGIGMLERAAAEHGVDMERSIVVGDKASDLEAGRRAGCRTILVLTGYGTETRERLDGSDEQPDFVADDILDAVRWLLPSPQHWGRLAQRIQQGWPKRRASFV